MTSALVRRLADLDPTWSFDILRVDVAVGEVLVLGRLTLKGAHRTAFGSAKLEGRLADAAHTAAEASLESAAALLGVTAAPPRTPATDEHRRHTPSDAPEPIARVTGRQLAAIHALARRRGMSLPELGAVVRERTGKTAVDQLTRREASGLLDAWNAPNGT